MVCGRMAHPLSLRCGCLDRELGIRGSGAVALAPCGNVLRGDRCLLVIGHPARASAVAGCVAGRNGDEDHACGQQEDPAGQESSGDPGQ